MHRAAKRSRFLWKAVNVQYGKPGEKIAQLVLQHYNKNSWKALLRVLPPTNQTFLASRNQVAGSTFEKKICTSCASYRLKTILFDSNWRNTCAWCHSRVVLANHGNVSQTSWHLFGPEKLFRVGRVCIQDQGSNKFENDTIKLSFNEAKLSGLWARNCATIQQVLIYKLPSGPKRRWVSGPFEKRAPEVVFTQLATTWFNARLVCFVGGKTRNTVFQLVFISNAAKPVKEWLGHPLTTLTFVEVLFVVVSSGLALYLHSLEQDLH